MGLGFGFSKSKGKSKSKSESGVSLANRGIAFDKIQDQTSQFQGDLGNFVSNIPQLGLGSTGLTHEQQGQADHFASLLGRSLFSKLSAGGALKGQTGFQNTSNVIGSAAEKAAASVIPQTLQLAGQNQQFNASNIFRGQTNKLAFQNDLLKIFAALATGGSTGSASQKQSSFGFNFDSGLSAALGTSPSGTTTS